MEITVNKRYLVFPVNSLASTKQLVFRENGIVKYKLDMKLDYVHPDFYAYIDVARFAGSTLNLSVFPEMELRFRQTDEMEKENLYREPMRPQIHFTTRNGWLNDPNGLIYLDGTYHLFYQHNPAEPNWGNMHWGHAVSQDLIHWEERELALFPDERGTMFSGSAVLDEENLLGKNTQDRKAVALFYTTTSPFSQNLSWSADGLKTIEKFDGNPVVPHIVSENRDPKVQFCRELGCYVMALYLQDDLYSILRSEDLVHWEELQRIVLKGEYECPDIFPICDGEGTRKWVFIGCRDHYLVGSFQSGKFVPEQEIKALSYGNAAVAGQNFSNLQDGRTIRMEWDCWDLPAPGFNGQMGIPMELSLERRADAYYLKAKPVRELDLLCKHKVSYENVRISNDRPFVQKLEEAPQRVHIKGTTGQTGRLTLRIFGRTVDIDLSENTVKLGRITAPVSVAEKELDMILIMDTCSIELFLDDGRVFASCLDTSSVIDWNLPWLRLETSEQLQLQSVEISALNSIWL